MKKEKLNGSCLCGNIQYQVQGPIKWCANCHCTRCQRSHGSGFVTWVGVLKHQFNLIKQSTSIKWYPSSEKSEYGFCPICGTSLLFRSEKWPDEIHFTLANITSDHQLKPTAHAYFDTHVDWLNFEDDLEKYSDPNK